MKIKWLIAFSLFLLCFADCKAQLTAVKCPEGKAMIAVIRSNGIQSWWCNFPVIINGKEVFSLKKMQYGYVFVDPGMYSVVCGEEIQKKGNYIAHAERSKFASLNAGEIALYKMDMQWVTVPGNTYPAPMIVNFKDEKELVKMITKSEISPSNTEHLFTPDKFNDGKFISAAEFEAVTKKQMEQLEKFNSNLQQLTAKSQDASATNAQGEGNPVIETGKDKIPATTYASKKRYLEGQIKLCEDRLKRAEDNYKRSTGAAQNSYQYEIDRLTREKNKYDMQLLDLDQRKMRHEIE